VRKYGCATRDVRGTCANHLKVRHEILDRAILDALAEVLDQRILVAVVDGTLDALRQGQAADLDRRTQIERELSLLEHRKQRAWDTYLNGDGPMPEVMGTIKAEFARKEDLARELEQLDHLTALARLDAGRLKAGARRAGCRCAGAPRPRGLARAADAPQALPRPHPLHALRGCGRAAGLPLRGATRVRPLTDGRGAPASAVCRVGSNPS
jgi:hypothetical protein